MIAAVAQARMSSSRLPGKVLRPLAGKPVLEYLLERLQRAGSLDLVVVATSVDASDDAIEDYCRRAGAEVHRGPLEDVAGRYGEVIDRFGLSAFARVTADSPFLDQRVVDRAVGLFEEVDLDVVTNVRPSTYPSGQSVEVVSAEAFRSALPEITDPGDREHVVPFFYGHPDRFRIENFTAHHDDSSIDLSIDTLEDVELLESMIALMDRPHHEYTSDQLVELHRSARGEAPGA